MSLWTRMANVFRGERVNREIDEELEAHVDDAMAEGRDAEEARRAPGHHCAIARKAATLD
jgi:putative ABC transport system permease protein